MVKIRLTEGQKSQGAGEVITWGRCPTEYGADAVLGWTGKGLRWLGFGDTAEAEMRRRWVKAVFEPDHDAAARLWHDLRAAKIGVTLDLHGTLFQMKVWQELLKIRAGSAVHYADLAHAIGQPNAARAVGSAVGANPVSLFVPCHRVVPLAGGVGHYAWGSALKRRILGTEGCFYG